VATHSPAPRRQKGGQQGHLLPIRSMKRLADTGWRIGAWKVRIGWWLNQPMNETYVLVKMGSIFSPGFRSEYRKYLSCHLLVMMRMRMIIRDERSIDEIDKCFMIEEQNANIANASHKLLNVPSIQG